MSERKGFLHALRKLRLSKGKRRMDKSKPSMILKKILEVVLWTLLTPPLLVCMSVGFIVIAFMGGQGKNE